MDFSSQKSDIRDIHIPVDFHTQQPRGFAYIEFEDIIESEAACKAEQNLVINGQKLSVQFAFGDRKSEFYYLWCINL